MKKSTKLLSVLLAIVMILSSLSVAAFASRTSYKTSENLTALGAYSPDGTVTRLSSEERMSIVFDTLDDLLETANINPGQLFSAAGLSLSVDLRSVDAILGTVDNVYSLKKNILVSSVAWMLGIVDDLNINSWQTGMTRTGTAQLTIVFELLELLNANKSLVQSVISSGEIDLGVINVDLGSVATILKDLTGFIKGMIFPLFERRDDDSTQITALSTTSNSLDSTLTSFVQGLFTKEMGWTTYRVDASNACISNHTLPTSADDNTRFYYTGVGTGTITAHYYDTTLKEYTTEKDLYYKTEILDDKGQGTGQYTYTNAAKENIKYYETGSYWLNSLKASGNAATIMDISSNNAANMLYQMIPYVFGEMAPVVLNGSCKMLLAQWMGATKTQLYAGAKGTTDATTALSKLPTDAQAFFGKTAGTYLWEWSDYMTSTDGNGYYRFVDKDGVSEQWFVIDTSTANSLLNLFDLSYTVGADFLNEFIPTDGTGTSTSAKGYTTILQGLNDFLAKVVNTALSSEAKAAINWQTGDNSNLVSNLRSAIQYVSGYNPEYLFGTGYQTVYAGYYEMLTDTSSTNQEVVSALGAIIVKALMPQITLPSAANLKGQQFGAILACVVRELTTQLLPNNNYDALIYSNYNTKTLVTGKTNDYWLDVLLTMGTDIGMSYLSALADLGEDDSTYGASRFLGNKTYTVAGFNQKGWEAVVDWVIDWALSSDHEWCWRMDKFINTTGLTIALNTDEDPWVKLDKIITDLLPVDQVINASAATGQTWLETVLRDDFVMAIANLQFEKIVGDNDTTGLLNIPTTSVLRTTAVLPAVIGIVRDLVNDVFSKVGGGTLIATTYTTIDSLIAQSTGLAPLASNLLGMLYNAYNNGMLDTLLPFINMFLGWSTDAQTLSDPAVTFTNTNDYGYMYSSDGSTVSTTVKFRNASSGMLQRHGEAGSYTYDEPYTLVLEGVTTDDGTYTTAQTFPVSVDPGSSISFALSGTYISNKAIKITFNYHYLFKDGTTLGGTQSQIVYQYVSNQKPATEETYSTVSNGYLLNNTAISKVDVLRLTTTANPKYYVGTSTAIAANVTITFNQASNNGTKYGCWVKSNVGANMPDFVTANQGFVHGDDENSTYTSNGIGYVAGDDSTSCVVDPIAINGDADVSSYVSGTSVDLGTATITWHNHKKGSNTGIKDGANVVIVPFTVNLGTLLIVDTSDLKSTYDSYINKYLQRNNFASDADTEWEAYTDALAAANAILIKPVTTDTFSTDYSVANLTLLAENIESAYTALNEKQASASYNVIETAISTAEPTSTDTDYQDFDKFEYFAYEKTRTNARNVVNAYKQPSAPANYIDGCWLDADQIATVIAAETDTTINAALTSTVIEPTQDELDTYAKTLADWTAPTYTALANAEVAAKIGYYKQFLTGAEVTVNKQFLNSEIACATAQNYVEANYTTVSWARYAKALADAQTVSNDSAALQSEVFSAKYGLMVAQRQLKLVANDYKTQGDVTALESVMAQAEAMFTNAALFTYTGTETATEGWATLLKALGYTASVDTDNDASTANEDVQLYSSSASAFYDSELYYPSAANTKYVAAHIAELQAAMANFTCAISAVPDTSFAGNTTAISQVEYIVDGVQPGAITAEKDFTDRITTAGTPAGYTTAITSTRSAKGFFGTGAQVVVTAKKDGTETAVPVATYTLIIHGDVNGDGAVDAFDAFAADKAMYNGEALTGIYLTAGDINKGGTIELTDYSAILNASSGIAALAQA